VRVVAAILEGETELADVAFLIGTIAGLVAAVLYGMARSAVGVIASLAVAAIAFGLLAL
jgi:hypothetical protein